MSFIQKPEEILLEWRKDGWADRWYKEYGIEPMQRARKEGPSDEELEQYLQKQIEGIKYEDPKIAKIRNEEFWIEQVAAMRAFREECERICQLDDLKEKRTG